MAEQIGLRQQTTHDEAAPDAKRARTLTDKNRGVDGDDSAPPAKSPIARRRDERGLTRPR